MAVVIKATGQTAPAGSKKLYRDALVENGTLLCMDFSNKGTLEDFQLKHGSSVRDLARESSLDLGINNQAEAAFSSSPAANQLTAGRGFTINNLLGAKQVIKLGSSLNEYLFTKQPNTLFIIWLRKNGPGIGRLINSVKNSDPNDIATTNLRLSVTGVDPNMNCVISLGGHNSLGMVTQMNTGELYQYAVEYINATTPLRVYKNGVLLGSASAAGASAGFKTGYNFTLGKEEDSSAPNTGNIYRLLMEDLNMSGRSAAEVVLKDYNYVKALGEYTGIQKRPFVDTI